MKTKTKYVITCIVFIMLLGIAVAYFLFQPKTTSRQQSHTSISTPNSNQSENTIFNVINYTVYKNEDLDFAFVIAQIDIDKETNITLSDFRTNENIALDDIQTYVQQLENHSFYVGKANVWFTIDTSTDAFQGNIMIPVNKKDASKITLTCKDMSYTFDLTKNYGVITDLTYSGNTQVIQQDDQFEMTVTNGFEMTSDEMLEDGESMILPSTARVFAYTIAVDHLQESIQIESATLQLDDGIELQAEGTSVSSMKYENMIGKDLQENIQACLFFITLDPERNITQTNGTLQIQLSNTDEPIEIRVTMEG